MSSDKKELLWVRFSLVITSCTVVILAAETHHLWILIPWAIVAILAVIDMILTLLLEVL